MRLRAPDGRQIHLCYCTNVHVGEDLDEVLSGIRDVSAVVRRLVVPDGQLGIGLYLSHAAAQLLDARPARRAELRRELDRAGLYVATMNAFPFGAFHAPRVKELVFRPMWNEAARVEHSLRCARLLAELAPDDVPATLSTHSGGPRELSRDASVARAMNDGFLNAWRGLEQLKRNVVLAIEPEPDSTHESVVEVAHYVDGELRPRARRAGLGGEHVGLCLDTCHAAVLFESIDALRACIGTQVRVAKMQLSSALEVRAPGAHPDACAELGQWREARWFHQVRGLLRDGSVLAAPDLETWYPPLEAGPWWQADAWRIHFHVPIFIERLGAMHTTREVLESLLVEALRNDWTRVFEVETYTFDRLPREWRGDGGSVDLACMLERELRWVLERMRALGFVPD